MNILKGIRESLQDCEAKINIYQSEIDINELMILDLVDSKNIILHQANMTINITGDNLKIIELTDIIKISGHINKIIYEDTSK